MHKVLKLRLAWESKAMQLETVIEDHLLYLRGLPRAERTIKLRKRDLERWRAFLEERGITDMRDIGPRDLWAFMAHIQSVRSEKTGKPLSLGTVGMFYRHLRAFLKWCKRAKILDEDLSEYIDSPPKDKTIKEHLEAEEVQALLDAVDTDSVYAQPERDRAIVLALVDTMARVSAFCQLRVEDLKPDGNGGGQAIVVEKGGYEHRLFFSPYSWGAIQELLEVHPLGEGPLFVSYNTGGALTADGVRQLLHRLGERAGIENVYPHRLGRRTGATLRSKDGCTNRVLMQLGGWKTEEMLRKYVNLKEKELAEVHTATSPLKHLTIPSKST